MRSDAPLVDLLGEGRARFLDLVSGIRPDLHRYCARMTGSTFDGEDVVQEVLARAYYELPQLREVPALRAWLFRIAHNCCTDFVRASRRRCVREGVPFEDDHVDESPSAEAQLIQEDTVRDAVGVFLTLPPSQRACVVLKDVLGFSLEEIAGVLQSSVPAVKAALHRGRKQLEGASPDPAPPPEDRGDLAARYAQLFNARDWDGVRALLADDVKLDLVARWKRQGRQDVSNYYTNYDGMTGWRAQVGTVEGRTGLLVFPQAPSQAGWYFIDLEIQAGGIRAIRDYRYSAYMFADLLVEPPLETP